MAGLAGLAHRIPDLFQWLDAREVMPAGASFFRYNFIDMEAELDVEVGVPVSIAVAKDGEVSGGVLPAGRYATVIWVGAPDTLQEATSHLLAWAAAHGLTWDMVVEGCGERWGCCIEAYLTDPRSEPDTRKWKTELAFRLAD